MKNARNIRKLVGIAITIFILMITVGCGKQEQKEAKAKEENVQQSSEIQPIQDLVSKLNEYANHVDCSWSVITLSDEEMKVLMDFIKKNNEEGCEGRYYDSFVLEDYGNLCFNAENGNKVLITNLLHIPNTINTSFMIRFRQNFDIPGYGEIMFMSVCDWSDWSYNDYVDCQNWTYTYFEDGKILLQEWEYGELQKTIEVALGEEFLFSETPEIVCWNNDEEVYSFCIHGRLILIVKGEVTYIDNVSTAIRGMYDHTNTLYYNQQNQIHIRCISTGEDQIVADDFSKRLKLYYDSTRTVYYNELDEMVLIPEYFDEEGQLHDKDNDWFYASSKKLLICTTKGEVTYIDNVSDYIIDFSPYENTLYYLKQGEIHIRCISTGEDYIVANDFSNLSYFDEDGKLQNYDGDFFQSHIQEWLEENNPVVEVSLKH